MSVVVAATALLVTLLLAVHAPTTVECAAPGSDGAGPSGRGLSPLLASLKQYEVVAVRAPQLDRSHRRSIVLGAQEEQRRARRTLAAAAAAAATQPSSEFARQRQQQERQERDDAARPRQFSRRVSLSFRTLLGATSSARTLSAGDDSDSAAADNDNDDADGAAPTDPVDFDLQLSKMSDLFHPSYSQTRQVWREGKRMTQEEKVQELSSVEQCYYRASSFTSKNYLALQTCGGGFSGFVRRDGVVWMVEPAARHLAPERVAMHLHAARRGRMQIMRAGREDAFAAETMAAQAAETGAEAEAKGGNGSLEASHLHILFRASDVAAGEEEFTCTVGLSDEDKLELARTGRLGPGALRRADGPQSSRGREQHAQAHSHSHSHDEHDGHEHDHAHAHAHAHNSAYSTWLAAMDSSFARRTMQRMRDAEAEAEADAGVGVDPEDRLRRAGLNLTVKAGEEVPQSMPSHGFGFVTDADAGADADSGPGRDRNDHSGGRGRGRAMRSQAVASSLKYVEMLVTNDHARFLDKGDATEQSTAAIVGMIKATYEATTGFSPRLTVVLIGQITWIERDPYTIARGECAACLTNNGVSVDELLKLWNNWRSNGVNVAPYAHDNGQLYSGYPFEIPTLGYAGVGAMCTPSISGGIQSMLREEFYNHIIAAHELGHNFGMNHDSSYNDCPESGFIMNAVLRDPTPTVFSECSTSYQSNFLSVSHITCLDNVPTQRYGAAVCGNGFVEEGEQCDCGLSESCQVAKSRDPCCNATSCAFVAGASCSATQGCCENCGVVPAEAQKVCRASAGSCDLPEVCTGLSAACPADGGLAAGTACSAGQYGPGLCYLNSCLSYLQQCRTAGANFPGAPYDTCVQQSQLNQGAYCSTLWCSSVPGQCTYFRQSGVVVGMADGVPCPSPRDTLTYQCQRGACVNPDSLNVNFVWQASPWEVCTDCEAQQHRNVSCTEVATNYVSLHLPYHALALIHFSSLCAARRGRAHKGGRTSLPVCAGAWI